MWLFRLVINYRESVERIGMHEISIVESLIDIVKSVAEENKLKKIEKLHLCIGDMRQIVPEALLFAFEIVGKGTVAEGATVEITHIPASGRCESCNSAFAVEEFCFICPVCSSGNVSVVQGKELYIDSLEGD